jgi:hypothetical protein
MPYKYVLYVANTLICNDIITFKKSSKKQEKDSWRLRKTCRNYDNNFADQEFVIGFFKQH